MNYNKQLRYNDLRPTEIKRLLSLFNCHFLIGHFLIGHFLIDHFLIRIAVSIHVLVAILEKGLDLKLGLDAIPHIPSLTVFE